MILIGIAGPTCSGKITLLNNLRKELGDSIGTLSFDDYFIGSDIQDVDTIENFETPDLYNFNAFYDDLRKLKKGQSITLRANSRESVESEIKEKTLKEAKIVIVEGWLLFHDPRCRELFDGKIYLNISEDSLTKRRYERTNGSKHWDSHDYIKAKIIPALHQYVEPQRDNADLVLSGDESEQVLLDKTITFIETISEPRY